MNNNLNYIVWYNFCWKPRDNATLFDRLSREIRQESQLGERRRYRRQLRRDHLQLDEDECITATDSDAELHVLEQIRIGTIQDDVEEEELSTARFTLVEADIENQNVESIQSESLQTQPTEVEIENGKNVEDNPAISERPDLELFRVSSMECSSSSCDNDAESDDECDGRSTDSASNFYSASTSPTKSLQGKVDSYVEEEKEAIIEGAMGETGKLNSVKGGDSEFTNMLQGSGRKETML